jgi:hypothetical protein
MTGDISSKSRGVDGFELPLRVNGEIRGLPGCKYDSVRCIGVSVTLGPVALFGGEAEFFLLGFRKDNTEFINSKFVDT